MINFSEDKVFNLKPIKEKDIHQGIINLFIDGELIIDAFKTIRDQIIFTNKRIIAVDMQGVTGKKKEYSSLPYSKIQYFSIQTPGFAEIMSDSEMELFFTNGFKAVFEFNGSCDIMRIGKIISEYALR